MESMTDNAYNEEELLEEDRARLERRQARIARMRREKEKRETLNRLTERLLPLGAGVLGLVLVIAAGVILIGGKGKGKEVQPQPPISQAQVNQNAEAAQSNQSAQQESELAQVNPQMGPASQTVEGQATNNHGMSDATESDTVEPEEKAPLYTFESTVDTVTITTEEVISSHAILINESTDTIVASKAAKERICPASMTKVLTVLVAAEHITEAQLDDTFTMTLEITDYAYVNDCSSVGFLNEEEVTVRDLFYGTILPSGGDAAVGLATYVAGSHETFVDMMNEKLEELGIAETAHFTNCVGLYDKEHYCTVYDMAVIMKAAVQNELCKEVLSTHTYTTKPTVQHPEGITISNWFLRRIEDKDTGGLVLCGKTGYVVQSQNCAVSYGTFAGETPYICVTAGSTSSWRCIYDHVEIYTRYIAEQ